MEMKEFVVKVQNAVKKKLGKAYQVKLQEVQKNNGVLLQGLVILCKNQNISPTIYLNSFWEAYEEGMPLSMIVERILQIYEEDTPKENIDMDFFKQFERVNDRICYRLISAERNRELLTKIPHVEFLDMAICFYYAYESELLGSGSILIYNTHLEMWNTNVEELLKLAHENTPKHFPWEMVSMEEIVREMMAANAKSEFLEEEMQQDFSDIVPMQIVSNTKRVHGAACILYPGLLKQLAEAEGSNLYVIPSSIHEVIVLPDSGREDSVRLGEIISEVNNSCVEPEEVLSDNLYYYDCVLEQVKII